MLKIFFVILVFCTIRTYGDDSSTSYSQILKQSLKQYQAQDYERALENLNQAKASGAPLTAQWYYLKALSHMKLQNDEAAIENFNLFVENTEPVNATRGYYFLGQIYTRQKKYEEALTYFELAADTSADPQLDKVVESSIERTLRLQRENESNLSHFLFLQLGYGYDDNAVNLNSFFFDENLKGHTLSYGMTYAYLAKKNDLLKVQPSIAILDSYTLDGQFKSNEVVQSKDALLLNTTVPVQFIRLEGKNTNLHTIALNASAIYLPINSTKRELALTTVGLGYSLRQFGSTKLTTRYELNLNYDQSYNVETESDDATGLRGDFKIGADYEWKYLFFEKLHGNIQVEESATKGANTKYRKYYVDLGFSNKLTTSLTSLATVKYDHLNYFERSPERNDDQIVVAYGVIYEPSQSSTLDTSIKYTENKSNVDLYKSNDYSLSLQYTKLLSFP